MVVVQQADMKKPNVGNEVTKEVVKVVQELQRVLELWSGWWAIGEVMVVIEMVVDE